MAPMGCKPSAASLEALFTKLFCPPRYITAHMRRAGVAKTCPVLDRHAMSQHQVPCTRAVAFPSPLAHALQALRILRYCQLLQ
jgi:hypothetical protein